MTQPLPHESCPLQGTRELPVTRRAVLEGAILAAAGSLVAACRDDGHTTPNNARNTAPAKPELSKDDEFLIGLGESLLAAGEPSHGGLRYPSRIQDGHYQTDRDVGAAGVGMGFWVLAKRFPHDPRWTDGAKKVATWLLAVSDTKQGGRCWPDYVDDDNVSGSRYTSFDDGAPGIGDYLWRVSEMSDDAALAATAKETVAWTLARAENVGTSGEPAYRWRWDAGNGDVSYQMGMGEGLLGTIHTLATYYQRTKESDPAFAADCKRYLDGALRYMDRVRTALGGNDGDARAIPETSVIGQDGDTTMNSGYLSGAAGGMFMYLKLYQIFGDDVYLRKADEIFGWLSDTKNGPKVDFGDGTAAWKLALDPHGGDDSHFSNGIEEGNAGIGWVSLQAYLVTQHDKYLTGARQAADYLLKVAIKDTNGGLSWREGADPDSQTIHPNLNNGSAGIGVFLQALANVTGDAKYRAAAQATKARLQASAKHGSDGVLPYEDSDEGKPFSGDTSWHWGAAGIGAALAFMSGGTFEMPGEQEALVPSAA